MLTLTVHTFHVLGHRGTLLLQLWRPATSCFPGDSKGDKGEAQAKGAHGAQQRSSGTHSQVQGAGSDRRPLPESSAATEQREKKETRGLRYIAVSCCLFSTAAFRYFSGF